MEKKIETYEYTIPATTGAYTIEYSSGQTSGQFSAAQTVVSSASQVANELTRIVSSDSGFGTNVVGSVQQSNLIIDQSNISMIEQTILRAVHPVEFNESESLTVNGQTGIWVNKSEVLNWKGVIPITNYLINEDSNPEIIRKQTEQKLVYDQEVAIRYLRPPTPPPPGEILIRQEKNISTPPAPPLVIRQQPPRPETPVPLVIRETPPRPPVAVGQKVITISGKQLPPPPRKVVIERLAPMPSKPQSVIIERWLPYGQQKRRVIFQKNLEADPVVARPRNVIIQWETPAVQIRKEFKDLGVIRANPVEYVERYGASLKTHVELPQFVKEIRPPTGVVLAAEYSASSLLELEGDIQALSLIDLEREGLAEYRAYLARFSSNVTVSSTPAPVASSFSIASILNAILLELFQSVDRNASGTITVSEAESLLLKLYSRLGRNYSEADAVAFVKALDINGDGSVSFDEFRSALLKDFNA